MQFDPKVILQGNQDKRALEENPTVGFTASGASSPEPTEQLGKDPRRMAGPGGAFAFRMMQDPDFAVAMKGGSDEVPSEN